MNRITLSIALLAAAPVAAAAQEPAATITAALHDSADGWNRGDLEAFVATYDEAATYIGSEGPIGLEKLRGYYEDKYFTGGEPDQQLRFEAIEVSSIESDHALVVGRWVLSGGGQEERRGWFTLLWRRTGAGWRIIHDHSS